MNWLRSRRGLLTVLVVALCGLAVSAALVVRAATGTAPGGPADFGAEPVTGAASTGPGTGPVTGAPDTATAAGPDAASTAPGAAGTSTGADTATGTDASRSPAARASLAAPTRLLLPRLDLSAAVDPVGVADDGRVAVPPDPRRVGWYRFSPRPGASGGSSVIVGHVDSDDRGLGVLVALAEVRAGDRVTVERADGSRVHYRVVSRRTVAKEALAASGAFRSEGPAVLTLVTCTGPYLPDRGGYRNNLVVTAVEASK
ncbi:sortase domain-bontaining protein [Streptomyces longwoodensis]|uniref:class F sortase n=1 Tax=Streptomyces longwoodensis TaxID=68231 RepID=UPI003673C6B8